MLNIKNAITEAIEKVESGKADSLRKALTVSTGFSVENHEMGYRDMVPAHFSWFRDRVFRNPNAAGSGIAWDTLTARDTNNMLGYVAEGKRAGAIQLTKGAGSANFATIGVEDSYTAEAKDRGASLFGTGEGLKDLCIGNLMQQFAVVEERVIPFANRDLDLGAPAAPTGTAASGGALAADDYWAVAVALTADQLSLYSSVTTGLSVQQAVTSPAGESYTLNAGVSKRGADSAAVAATLNQKITWSVAAIKGAVAYAWFIGKNTTTIPADTALYLHAVTYTNSYELSSYVTTGQTLTASGAIAGTDYSKDATYAPGGIFYQWANSGDGYWASLDDAALTMTNGRVTEIMTALASFFDDYKIGPEAIHMSAGTYTAIESLAFSSSNPRTMFVVSEDKMNSGMILGGRVVGMVNPYTHETIEFVVNPNMPDSLLFFTKMNYVVPGSPSSNTVELESFGGVWRVDWEPITRTNYHGAYQHFGMKLYVPFCFGAIGNVNIG